MPETLGQYKLLDLVGAGALGELVRARDTRYGRTVALRVLPEELAGDPQQRERFLADARQAATLSHPNIAATYEIGEDQGQLFVAGEFVPGEPLQAVIGGHPLNPRRAIDFAVQIADALADAHAGGVVHRALGTDTIFITPKDKAKILDFGMASWTRAGRARAGSSSAAESLGESAEIAYVSPEQASGQAVDHRSDIFSFGVVLFEMLTGRLPFPSTAASAPSPSLASGRAPAPSTINPAVPRELDPIVAKALARSVDRRYQSAATIAAQLRAVEAILDAREAAGPPARPPAARAKRRPSRWWVLLLVALVLGALGWIERRPLVRLWTAASAGQQ